jgi:hypothetical protein
MVRVDEEEEEERCKKRTEKNARRQHLLVAIFTKSVRHFQNDETRDRHSKLVWRNVTNNCGAGLPIFLIHDLGVKEDVTTYLILRHNDDNLRLLGFNLFFQFFHRYVPFVLLFTNQHI